MIVILKESMTYQAKYKPKLSDYMMLDTVILDLSRRDHDFEEIYTHVKGIFEGISGSSLKPTSRISKNLRSRINRYVNNTPVKTRRYTK